MDIQLEPTGNPTSRSPLDRNDLLQLVSLFLLVPAIGLLLTLIPTANSVDGRRVAPDEIDAGDARIGHSEDGSNKTDPGEQNRPEESSDNLSPQTPGDVSSSDDTVTPPDAAQPGVAAEQAPSAPGPASAKAATTPPTIRVVPPIGEVAAPLSAPKNVTALASPDGVVLTWQAASSATKYNLYRGGIATDPTYFTTVNGATSYTDAVAPGLYRYYVVSIGSSGAFSNKSNFTKAVVVTD